MAGFVKIKDITQAGKARSSNISAETLVNLYYEKNDEMAKNGGNSIYGTPGLLLFKDMGYDTPIYATHSFQGYLYVVTNDHLYVMTPAGVVTELGYVGTTNQNMQLEDNGQQVLLLTPSGAGYLATPTTFTQITDATFNAFGPGTFDVLAGYTVLSIQNSNQFFWSNLNDASTYDATAVATAEQSPDNIVRVFRNNADLFVFKQTITEIWQLTGNADLPFAPAQGLTFQQGCAAALSVAKIKGGAFWLGSDKSIYLVTGYQFKKVSTVDIDNQLNELTDISDAIGFTYSQAGHWFYVLTFPSEDLTVCYDLSTDKWHIRKSYGVNRWRINTFAGAFNKLLVGDFETSKIYELDLNTYTDNGAVIERIGITPPLNNGGNRFFIYAVELDLETGVGLLDTSPATLTTWYDYGSALKPLTSAGSAVLSYLGFFPDGSTNQNFVNSSMSGTVLVDPTLATTPGVVSFKVGFNSGAATATARFVFSSGVSSVSQTGVRLRRNGSSVNTMQCTLRTQTYDYVLADLPISDNTDYEWYFIATASAFSVYDAAGILISTTTTQTSRTATAQATFKIGQQANVTTATTNYDAGIYGFSFWDGEKTVEEMVALDNVGLLHSYRLPPRTHPQGYNPQAQLAISQDGAHTFSDYQNQPIGKMGQYKTVVRWSQIGFGYNTSLKFRITEPIKVAISGIYAIIKAGIK